MMADPFSKTQSVPAKTAQAPTPKRPAPPSKETNSAPIKQVSYGLLSLLVGSVALSFYSVPYLLVRILAVMLSLGGIGLAVLQFRSDEKAGRNFNAAIAGTMFSAVVLLLMAIGPYLPSPAAQVASSRTSGPKPAATIVPPTDNRPNSAINVAAQDVSPTTPRTDETLSQLPQIPSRVPKVIPFPCRKSFLLVPSTSPEWVDAATSAVLQGEVAVCVASAAIERPEHLTDGKLVASANDYLVIHLQVVLIGTTRKVDFQGWGNSNLGDARQRPSLSDNSKHAYRLRTFEAGTQVENHERSKGLYPKLYADDYLIFDTPDPSAEYLRLELPAAAFGEMGTLRFQISKSIIEGVVDSQPAK